MRSIFDFNLEEFATLCAECELPSYTAKQVFDWVYAKGVLSPVEMTNLGKPAREFLAEHIDCQCGSVHTDQLSSDGTQKLLLDWTKRTADLTPLKQLGSESRRQAECVLIPTEDRKTACLSSQVGCPVGCTFCASGLNGLSANLTTGEIVEQVWRLRDVTGIARITNIVFMGMGEPLSNYKAVAAAIHTLHAGWGFGISARRITVSTVGLPTVIRKLCAFELPITLALSLHAPNDEIRRSLIPWAQYTTIAELMDACQEYFDATGREITFEYILLRNVNDRPSHAHELARVAQRVRANVNLIRYNEVPGLHFERPASDDVHTFQQILRRHGVNAHIRASRGRDIAAACGQLKRSAAATSQIHNACDSIGS